MPTEGSVLSFNQVLPFYADKSYISNTFAYSGYNTFTENVVNATKFYASSINGVGSDDVRVSKRKFLSTKRLRGFKEEGRTS